MPVNDTLDAFVSHGHFELAPTSTGPLEGLTFALKDLFHVAGVPTAAGSPAWLASHGVPDTSAPVVDMLLGAGARLVGKTHTDEMAWSLNGENHHYGTPINPAAPERIPGGSSSGSAAATAGGLVDFAIGSDTGGSVRLPASYCGLFGLRPTHGRISHRRRRAAGALLRHGGLVRARCADLREGRRRAAGRSLRAMPPAPRLLLARDLFEAAGPKVTAALAPALARMTALCMVAAEAVDVAHGALPHWRNVFRILQSADAWAAHADWVRAAQPDFGPGVKERFAAAATLDPGRSGRGARLAGAGARPDRCAAGRGRHPPLCPRRPASHPCAARHWPIWRRSAPAPSSFCASPAMPGRRSSPCRWRRWRAARSGSPPWRRAARTRCCSPWPSPSLIAR